jgi:hypothetical protein
VELDFSIKGLDSLPQGASYSGREGRAKASITRQGEAFRFTASCDSLTFLIEEMTTEIYRLSRENDLFKSELNRVETQEVRRLTFLDNLQIWAGRILLLALLAYIAYRRFKAKFQIINK